MPEEKKPDSFTDVHNEIKLMNEKIEVMMEKTEKWYSDSVRQFKGSLNFTAYGIAAAVGFLGISMLISTLSQNARKANGVCLIAIGIGFALFLFLRNRKVWK